MEADVKMPVRNLCLIISGIGSLVFYGIFYYNHLYQREQLQLFQLTIPYLFKNLAVQGGFSIWLGEFLTQFFRVPFAGAVIITSLLFLLQRATEKILSLTPGGRQLQLYSLIPPAGYFFLLADQYYYLSGLIGLDLSLLGILILMRSSKPGFRIPACILTMAALYWLTGAGYIVFALVSVILILFSGEEITLKGGLRASLVYSGLLTIIAVAIPLAARKYLLTDTLLQSYVSEAWYAVRIFFPLPLVLVLLSVPLLAGLSLLIPSGLHVRQLRLVNGVFFILVSAVSVYGFSRLVDSREERTIRYENLVYDRKWDRIIKTAQKDMPSGMVPVAAVNLALAETGQLPGRMFDFDQGKDFLFINYVRKGMTPFMASETYYYLGLVNFSQMYALETIESTVDAKIPIRSVRRAAETFLLNGQYATALKYLSLARNTVFYRRWADKYISMINSDPVKNDDGELDKIRRLMPKYDFYYDYRRMDIALKYLLVSNPENKLAAEYLAAFYLLNKDLDGFLQSLDILKKLYGDNLPVACQEAIAYVLTRVPQRSEELAPMITDRSVVSRLQSYARLFSESGSDTLKMEREFGRSYWFYLNYR